ncbi:MAG: hypothetical protein ACRESC_00575 [Gammaproteobacteria bacterium]
MIISIILLQRVYGLILFPAQPAKWMMLMPRISQEVPMVSLLKDETLNSRFIVVSVINTILPGLIPARLADGLYRQGKILVR